MEPFGVPDVSLHPGTVLFLPQFELVEEEPELASMSTALRSTEDLSFVGVKLMQGFEPDSHGDPVVVVRHAATP